ncbi:glycosyltransferase [Actinophytocola glycyrrhizae]|uniref:Glycosyltransferase n=1 Tax=Actinophytocola glycyrrhizae TaxID=2044873 RepID=A0ABV9SCQ6_9PSEU
MRIVQLANFYSPTSGGLRTVVDTLGRGYVAAGYERVLVVPGMRRERLRTDAGLVITLPGVPVSGGYRMLPRPAAVCGELAALGDDLVLEVSDKTTLLAVGDWARDRGVPTVLLSHERLDRWIEARVPRLWRAGAGRVMAPAVRRWNRGLVNRFDALVVTSRYAEGEFAGLPVRALHRIPLGVDLDTFRPQRTGHRRGPARLVYAGRLSPEKNPRAVVGAVRELVAAGVAVRLDVYGDGPEHTALRKLARGLPVDFHGHVSDRAALARALSGSDVAFAPSVAETFGLSILEAMACGTPVLTSVTGGAPELLAPGAGVAVAATPAGLAGGVAEVLSWPVPWRRAAARERAEQFPWSRTVDAMLELHTATRV